MRSYWSFEDELFRPITHPNDTYYLHDHSPGHIYDQYYDAVLRALDRVFLRSSLAPTIFFEVK